MSKTFVAVFIITKGIRIDGIAKTPPMTGFLALTFGTLLSSQGTDAHHSRPSDLSWGNRSTLCLRPPRCQRQTRARSLRGDASRPVRSRVRLPWGP